MRCCALLPVPAVVTVLGALKTLGFFTSLMRAGACVMPSSDTGCTATFGHGKGKGTQKACSRNDRAAPARLAKAAARALQSWLEVAWGTLSMSSCRCSSQAVPRGAQEPCRVSS